MLTKQCTRQAHAKINLLLDMTGRRSDGYHTITGVMQSVSLADTVTVTVEGSTDGMPSINLTCTDPSLPADQGNIAWRAAEAFLAATGCGCEHLSIHIDKHIPAAAGMAGGSTDAAATLAALNELFDYPVSEEALTAVGLGIGADVPFCLIGGTQLTEGVGEALTPLSPLPSCEILVACAGEGVSTPAAYRALDERYGGFAEGTYAPHMETLSALVVALNDGDLDGVCSHTFNLFESVILPNHPTARMIKETMLTNGACVAMMSGSGPSVFGLFRDGDNAIMDAESALRNHGIPVWRCRPMTE